MPESMIQSVLKTNYGMVKAYADHKNDGIVQVAFTLPVPYARSSSKAALELAKAMGLVRPEVVHCQRVTDGYTYFIVYAHCPHSVDFEALQADTPDVDFMTQAEVEAFSADRIGRLIVVVGASTGTDTHSVGIDAMLNLKGFDGHSGLEAYACFRAYNLGSQVPNGVLVAKAVAVNADAILVSQTVTQQQLHVHNLAELVDIVEAEGIRKDVLLVCGGPRVSDELAKELGFDVGFSKGTYPNHLASFIVTELAARTVEARRDSRLRAAGGW